jgi:1-acyl-sn-glycerol-3-phosphate acyltransferase
MLYTNSSISITIYSSVIDLMWDTNFMQPETKIEAGQYAAFENPLQRAALYVSQLAIYPVLLVIRLLFVRDKLYRDSISLNFGPNATGTSYVLYANHQSKLDPFIICGSLPFRTMTQLLPFRFFVDNSYFQGITKVFLNAIGGFPAHYVANKPYGLDKARSVMATNQTVVIFPSGTRTRQHIAKAGVSVLATEPNSYLIPIHLEWKNRWSCHVHIGAPIKGGTTHPPELLMDEVYRLPTIT